MITLLCGAVDVLLAKNTAADVNTAGTDDLDAPGIDGQGTGGAAEEHLHRGAAGDRETGVERRAGTDVEGRAGQQIDIPEHGAAAEQFHRAAAADRGAARDPRLRNQQ